MKTIRSQVKRFVLLGFLLQGVPAWSEVGPEDPGALLPDVVLERADWIELEPLSLGDLLGRVPGIVVARRGGLGSPEILNVTGSINGRVQLVVDGISILEPELEWPHLYSVQVSMLDRIEIHRTTDPARIVIWTRRSESKAPHVDFDLGRGAFSTRTRRVLLFTPPRAVRVSLAYEELLRRFPDDFRSLPRTEAPSDLGTYDNRSLRVQVEFDGQAGESLQLVHERMNDNAHGGPEDPTDLTSTLVVQNRLQWTKPLGKTEIVVGVGQRAWDRDRKLTRERHAVGEARTFGVVDVLFPKRGPWGTSLRARVSQVTADRVLGATVQREESERYDFVLRAERRGRLRLGARAGVHYDVRDTAVPAGQLHAVWGLGTWDIRIQASRGVSFAGYGERQVDPGAGRRVGTSVSGGIVRRGAASQVQLLVFGKRMQSGSRALSLFFPELGTGPSRVAGCLADASVRARVGGLESHLLGSLAWLPHTRQERTGLAQVQARMLLELRRRLFQNDLVVSILGDLRLESRREFTPAAALAPFVFADATLDLLLLRRAHFFWRMQNVLNRRYETTPGVLVPGTASFFGIRLRLLE